MASCEFESREELHDLYSCSRLLLYMHASLNNLGARRGEGGKGWGGGKGTREGGKELKWFEGHRNGN